MSTMTVLYRSITEADVEELLNDPRSSAMSRGDQFEVRDKLQERVDQLTEQNRELLEALQAAIECGMVPSSSAKYGGAARFSRQVHVADMIRAAIRKATGEEA